MSIFKRTILCVAFCLTLGLILAACGDSPTSTSAPTGAAVPTTARPNTASAATTAVATTASATTAAASAATTAAATTAASSATPAATSAGGTAVIPTIPGVQEVVLSQAATDALVKQMGNMGAVNNATIKIYVSDSDSSSVATAADTAITGAGYKFSLPGATRPVDQGDGTVGFYSKTGAPDILFGTGAVTGDPFSQGNTAGLSPDEMQKITNQIKGKKTLMFVVAAPNLLQALIASSNTPIPTSPVATTAAAGQNTAGQ